MEQSVIKTGPGTSMRSVLIYMILISLFAVQNTGAQSNRVFFGLGGLYHTFQDARFSDVQFTGQTIVPELGFRHMGEKSMIRALAYGVMLRTPQPNTEEYYVGSLGFNASVGYQRRIIPGLYVGPTWDVVDYLTRSTDGINNNSNFFHTASDLFLSARYLYEFNDAWTLEIGGDLGVVSLVKYAPSFTANFPQNIIDGGNASFQDMGTRDPFSLQYLEVKAGWQQLYLKTRIELFFKRRLSASYLWRMRSFSDQEDHPVTMANHNLTLRYHFFSRTR